MLRSQSAFVTAAAGTESVTFQLSTPKGKRRIIKRVDANLTAGAFLVGYKQQDRVIHEAMDVESFAQLKAEYDIPLEEGETFNLGFNNPTGGAITAMAITVWYDET